MPTTARLREVSRDNARSKAKPRAARKAKSTPILAPALATTMALTMPTLSVAGTHLAGALAQNHGALAGLVGCTVATVFGVSLHHSVKALKSTLHLPGRTALALALSLDATIVSAELVDTLAPEINAHLVCVATMIGIGLITATLNLVTFGSYRKA